MLENVSGARVEASRFERCRNGIQVAFCNDVGLDDVTAIDNRRHGIAALFSHDWHVTNCVAKRNGGREKDRNKHRGWGIAAGGGPERRGRTPNSDFTIANKHLRGQLRRWDHT
jgi:hypothetical protein